MSPGLGKGVGLGGALLVAGLLLAAWAGIHRYTPAPLPGPEAGEDPDRSAGRDGTGPEERPVPAPPVQSFPEVSHQTEVFDDDWGDASRQLKTIPARPMADDQVVGDYTIGEHRQFKQDFSCDLALEAREACEARERGPEDYEQCLSLRLYYTYSRHCGYPP